MGDKNQVGQLQIGEIAQLLGITTKTIRHYHKLGLLPEPQRADNGYRMYQIDDLMRLQKIMSLQKLGLSLKQIQFIFSAPDPDTVLQMLLQQRRETIDDELARLKRQRHQIDSVLNQDDEDVFDIATQPQNAITVSSSRIIYSAISPHASGLADVILAIESESLHQLDTYEWSEGYDEFWHSTVQNHLELVKPHEHDMILWLERYLALGDLEDDDLQARTWMDDLRYHPFRRVLAQLLCTPATGILPDSEAQQAIQLTSLLLYTEASPLQKQFLSLVMKPS